MNARTALQPTLVSWRTHLDQHIASACTSVAMKRILMLLLLLLVGLLLPATGVATLEAPNDDAAALNPPRKPPQTIDPPPPLLVASPSAAPSASPSAPPRQQLRRYHSQLVINLHGIHTTLSSSSTVGLLEFVTRGFLQDHVPDDTNVFDATVVHQNRWSSHVLQLLLDVTLDSPNDGGTASIPRVFQTYYDDYISRLATADPATFASLRHGDPATGWLPPRRSPRLVPLLTALSATLLVGLCCAVLLFVRRRNDSTTQSKPPDLPHNKYPLQERHYSESSLYFDDSFILSGNRLVVLQTSSDAARVEIGASPTAKDHRDVRRRLFHDDTPYDEEARDVSADGNN